MYGFVQACIGAGVCYQTIHSYWGSVDGVKTSAEGYIAPVIIVLNLTVLVKVGTFYLRYNRGQLDLLGVPRLAKRVPFHKMHERFNFVCLLIFLILFLLRKDYEYPI